MSPYDKKYTYGKDGFNDIFFKNLEHYQAMTGTTFAEAMHFHNMLCRIALRRDEPLFPIFAEWLRRKDAGWKADHARRKRIPDVPKSVH